jgi:hypothetical protein
MQAGQPMKLVTLAGLVNHSGWLTMQADQQKQPGKQCRMIQLQTGSTAGWANILVRSTSLGNLPNL